MILTPLQKLPNNVGDLAKIIVATCFEWLPKVQKSPNLVTLVPYMFDRWADPVIHLLLLKISMDANSKHLPKTNYSKEVKKNSSADAIKSTTSVEYFGSAIKTCLVVVPTSVSAKNFTIKNCSQSIKKNSA